MVPTIGVTTLDRFMRINLHETERDTALMSAAETGAWFLLAKHYWSARKLPIDDERLARLARVTVAEWVTMKATVMATFMVTVMDSAEVYVHPDFDLSIAAAEKAYLARKAVSDKANKAKAAKAKRQSATDGDLEGRHAGHQGGSHIHSSSLTRKKSGARAPVLVGGAPPPAAPEKDWADDHPTWASFKASMTTRDWAVYFKSARPNGSPTTLIVPTEFTKSTIQEKWGERLADMFGEAIVLKVERPSAKAAAA